MRYKYYYILMVLLATTNVFSQPNKSAEADAASPVTTSSEPDVSIRLLFVLGDEKEMYGVAYKSWMKRLYLSYFFSFDECRSYYNDGQCNNTLVRYLGKASRKYPGLNYDPTLDRSLINSMRPDGSGTKAVLGWPNLTGGLAYDSRKQILYFLAEEPAEKYEMRLSRLWSYNIRTGGTPQEVTPGLVFYACNSLALNEVDNVIYFYNQSMANSYTGNTTLLGWSLSGQALVDQVTLEIDTYMWSECNHPLRFDNVNRILFGSFGKYRTVDLWKNPSYVVLSDTSFSIDESKSLLYTQESSDISVARYSKHPNGTVRFESPTKLVQFYSTSETRGARIIAIPCVNCEFWEKPWTVDLAIGLSISVAAVVGPLLIIVGRKTAAA